MTPEIYIVKVNSPIDENVFVSMLDVVCKEKKERILRQRVKQNADNMLIGEILAKFMIKKIFGIDIINQKFSYMESGKPYLNGYPHIHFNISHSCDVVACILGDKPVGIDIQKISEPKAGVIERVCNKKELDEIENSSDKATEFTKIWTQKEAVIKCKGTGIFNSDIKECLKGNYVKSQRFEDFWISISYE